MYALDCFDHGCRKKKHHCTGSYRNQATNTGVEEEERRVRRIFANKHKFCSEYISTGYRAVSDTV